MGPLVDMPAMVQHYAPFLASVFSPQAFEPCPRYSSGWIGSENNTGAGITRLFVLDVRPQSRLTRLLTESPCAVGAFNRGRVALWPSLAGTQMQPPAVLSRDAPLLTP
jgi:hypothetical protein